MAPSPTGTACCMAWPRRRSNRAVSARSRLPTAVSAEYSPMEWPATKAHLSPRAKPPSASRVRAVASDTAIRAGWAFSVRTSLSSGPSNMSFDNGSPRASSTSSKTARAAANVSARPWPMPTCCEPWPGNTKPWVIWLNSLANNFRHRGRLRTISRSSDNALPPPVKHACAAGEFAYSAALQFSLPVRRLRPCRGHLQLNVRRRAPNSHREYRSDAAL